MLASLLTTLLVFQVSAGPEPDEFRAIESLILRDRPKEALSGISDLARAGANTADPRLLRLELLAHRKLGNVAKVRGLARALVKIKGWESFSAIVWSGAYTKSPCLIMSRRCATRGSRPYVSPAEPQTFIGRGEMPVPQNGWTPS